jgi:hypothetical protein
MADLHNMKPGVSMRFGIREMPAQTAQVSVRDWPG